MNVIKNMGVRCRVFQIIGCNFHTIDNNNYYFIKIIYSIASKLFLITLIIKDNYLKNCKNSSRNFEKQHLLLQKML